MLLIAILGLFVMTLVSSAFVASPNRGAALVLLTFTVETVCVSLPALPLGINVYVPDIVFILLFLAAVLRYLAGSVPLTRKRAAVIAMSLFFLVGLARGFATFGIKEAGLASRNLFYLYAGILYFSSFTFRRRQQLTLVNYWVAAAWVLVATAFFRWIATGMGLEIAASWEDMETSPMRVLNAGQTMFLCMAFFFCVVLLSQKRASGAQKALAFTLPPVIVLLQHRTVWIVFFFGIMSLFSRQTRQLRKVLLAALVLIVVSVPLIFFVFDASFVTDELVSSATDPTTLIWRIAGWRQLVMDRTASPIDYLIGQPAGTDQSRMIDKVKVEANPHNFYVQTFLCQGTAGLMILLWLYRSRIAELRRARRRTFLRHSLFPGRAWAMFLTAQMLFFLAYSPSYDQMLVFGMALGMACCTPVRVRSRHPKRRRAIPLRVAEGLT